MLFNSFTFLCVFLPIVLFFYYLPVFRRFQIPILMLAGFIFYSYSHLEYLVLLVVSALLNAIFSYCVIQSHSHAMQRI